jgi:hypothetical protein
MVYAGPRLSSTRRSTLHRLAIAIAAALACAAMLSTAWAGSPAAPAQLPPSAQVGHGGIRAELSVPAGGAGIWRVRAYRARGSVSSPRRIPGSIDLCLALDRGGKRWSGIVCELTASLGLRLQARSLSLDCGAPGVVVGDPVPPAPTCGLVESDVAGVTVTAEGRPPQAALLSEPFQIRVNHSNHVLRRQGLDPERVRALPRELSLRAFLAFVDTPPTPPGKRTPKITVTATRSGGGTVSEKRDGFVVPRKADLPSLIPPPGAKRARLSATGPDGKRWVSVAWRQPDGGLCANVMGTKRHSVTSVGCHGSLQLIDEFSHHGAMPYVDGAGKAKAGFAVYGTVRGDAQAVTVVAPDGRLWNAQLSPVWTTVRRHTGNHLKRFRKLPRSMPARSFLAVLPGKAPIGGRGLELRTTLADGRVLVHKR